jgi:predicted CoA-binding protein
MSDVERLAIETIRSYLVRAVVGASQDPERYCHEVVAALRAAGKRVLPMNPKYTEIDGSALYPSLEAFPEPPHVVVVALAPERATAAIAALPPFDALVWLPPGCWSESILETCR